MRVIAAKNLPLEHKQVQHLPDTLIFSLSRSPHHDDGKTTSIEAGYFTLAGYCVVDLRAASSLEFTLVSSVKTKGETDDAFAFDSGSHWSGFDDSRRKITAGAVT